MRTLYGLPALVFLLALAPLRGQDATWFADVSHQVGFDSVPAWRLYVSDVNGDRYPDLMIINGIYTRNQLSLWLNLPDPDSDDPSKRVFVDVTEQSGINANPNPEIDGRVADVGALADIDNDGDPDLVTGRFFYAYNDYQMPEDVAAVMLNDGNGVFSLVPENGIDKINRLNATGNSFLDYDLDGLLDIYIGTFSRDHAQSAYMQDYLFRGNGDGTFTDVSKASGISSIRQPLYGVNACDWNNDGLPDIITSPYCRTDGSLWMNNGDGTFIDVGPAIGYSAHHLGGDNGQALCQWEGMPADFDNDGDFDILQVLVHGGYNANEGHTVIAVNGGPADYLFQWELNRIRRDAPVTSHLGDMSASWVDLDNDGRLDIIINESQYPQANAAGVERSYFMWQNEEHFFDDITADLGLSDLLLAPGASEVIDYDLDGDDDLLIVVNTNKNQSNRLVLLRNDAGNKNNWVGVELKAPGGVNRDAIGARIYVTAGGVTQMREQYAGGGHFGGQQPLIRNIGIGENETIDRIEVRWPHAAMPNTVIENPPINQILTIDGSGLSALAGSAVPHERMTLAPNPVRDRLTVRLPDSFRSAGELRISDAVGRQVRTEQVPRNGREHILSVSGLPPGYYILQIKGEKEEFLSRPFIVE